MSKMSLGTLATWEIPVSEYDVLPIELSDMDKAFVKKLNDTLALEVWSPYQMACAFGFAEYIIGRWIAGTAAPTEAVQCAVRSWIAGREGAWRASQKCTAIMPQQVRSLT